MAASRLTLAAAVFLPVWSERQPAPRSAFWYAVAAGMVLALHFAAWITSLSYTSIAASTTIVTTNPIWITLLSWWIWGERPQRWTVIGMTIALISGGLIGLSDSNQMGINPLLGNSLALIGAWAVSGYFLLGREAQKQGLSTRHYAGLAYGVAAITLLPLPFLLKTSYSGYPPLTYVYIGLMALLPQLIGHTSLNWAVRWVSPTLVTLTILFEPVIASLFGYWLFAEIPGTSVLLGAIGLLTGVAIAATASRSTPS
jgi:drug/metabolite transporter (DMT)-like permease